jgi:hypothetical protein
MASGGRTTVILNAKLSDKKTLSEEIKKTKEMTIIPNHTCTLPKISCWKDPFGSSVDHNFAKRR